MAGHKGLRKAKEADFKANFSSFASLSPAETHAFAVEFIGLYGTFFLLRLGTLNFPVEEKAIC